MSRFPTWDVEQKDNLETFITNEANPLESLAIDPGKFNGVCGYDSRHYLQFMYVVDFEDMVTFLNILKRVKRCIIEDYTLFPNKAMRQTYSDMPTSRMIGRVESWAELHSVELIKQLPTIKVTAYKWLGKKPPAKSTNLNDPWDAHAHFTYWAIKNKKINPAVLLKEK
jgi:hypothetical protein